uniref:Uncharacterized protein n=1 Tax=Siphoviridae sp. ctuUw41 TaxID=2826503 RepID=A0A8S5MXZ3_9CAUD|nr:MAG TPA: hypothetical protein [Siphoviridae sp. ctuUw41]
MGRPPQKYFWQRCFHYEKGSYRNAKRPICY